MIRFLFLGVLLLAGGAAPANPSPTSEIRVEFTSVPAFGSSGPLRGRVLGVNPSLYRVAVFIYVHGWWTKPTWASPLTVMDSQGHWTCNVTTGGSDQFATKLAAFVVPAGYSPPLMSGGAKFPAGLEAAAVAKLIQWRLGRQIRFSGYDWAVKQGYWGPGPNYFSDHTDNVWVDAQGQLHLRITYRDGAWRCAEVINQQSLGHGIYEFTLASRVHALDPNVVLGLFTWSDDPDFAYRELDIELSRWGQPGNAFNAQYVVQPYNQADHLHRFAWPKGISNSTHSIIWDRARLHFRSARGDSGWPADPTNVIHSWDFPRPTQIPPQGDESPRLNLWLVNGRAPMNGSAVEVVVKRFQFTPFGPPTILTHPASQTVVDGATARFDVVAESQAALNYQWRFRQTNIARATNASLWRTNIGPSQAGRYSVVVSGTGGSVTSSVARLTISNVPPVILKQPRDLERLAATSATFRVESSGPRPLSYQWRFNGADLPGATNAKLVLPAVLTSDEGDYQVVLRNPVGSVTSRVARLTVQVPAAILEAPQGRAVAPGSSVTLSVVATGTFPLSYQWLRNGLELTNRGRLSGTTSPELTLTNIRAGDAGYYRVRVSNPYGTVVSQRAALAVLPAPLAAAPDATEVSARTTKPSLVLDLDQMGLPCLRVLGVPGESYAVETSEDLVQWTRLDGVPEMNSSAWVKDTAAGRHACRFYRLRSLR